MNENRRKVLEMLAAGKITADQAERLLTAVEAPAATTADPAPRPSPKYLRVLVQEAADSTTVNARIPMQLLRAGVKLTGLIPSHARDQINDAMREQGVPFDINQLKPDNLQELIDQLAELTVDVDQDGTKVKVFCE